MNAMTPLHSHSDSGHGMRRMVRLQRSYTCPGCDSQHEVLQRLLAVSTTPAVRALLDQYAAGGAQQELSLFVLLDPVG